MPLRPFPSTPMNFAGPAVGAVQTGISGNLGQVNAFQQAFNQLLQGKLTRKGQQDQNATNRQATALGYAGLGTSLAGDIANPLIGYSLLGDPNDIFAKSTDEAFQLQEMNNPSVLGPLAGTVDLQPKDVPIAAMTD